MCLFALRSDFFFGTFSRFDALIISSEVGYEKPDPNIFKAALGMKYHAISSYSHSGEGQGREAPVI